MSDGLVKRYSSYNIMMLGDSGNEVSTPDGKWVKYKDYKAQSARIEELEAELEGHKKLMLTLAGDKIDLVSELAGVKFKLAKAVQGLEDALEVGMAYSDDRLGYDGAISLLNGLKGEQDDR